MNLEEKRHPAFIKSGGGISLYSLGASAMLVMLGLAGCNSGTDATQALPTPRPVFASVFVAQNNGAALESAASNNSQGGTANATIATGGNEGIAFDKAGNLAQASDNGAAPNGVVGIRTFCSAANLDGDPAGFFREISGDANLTTPKGMAIAHEAGYYFIAQNTPELLIFGSAAAGNTAPVDTLTLTANAWDMAYDGIADRLFVALTDGTVAVFDDFIADGFGDSGAARFIDPTATTPSNLHGIAYDAQQDRLVVSDVGDAAIDTDGALYIIESASTAESTVAPSKTIAGSNSMLGNPVDLVLTGVSLRVAEKSNDAVLFYNNIFAGAGGDVPPDDSYPFTDPESLAVASTKVFPSVNDIGSGAALAMTNIAVISNAASPTNQVTHFARDLSGGPAATFDVGTASVENLTFDANGDGYVTFDNNTAVVGTGGIAIVGRLAKGRSMGAFDATRDRTITGATAGLASPKGVTTMGNTGLIAVAENSATGAAGVGIYVFSSCATGNVAPLATVSTAAAPWDSDYDAGSDLLFVALTNGTVEIYPNFSTILNPSSDPLEADPSLPILTISLGATNLHGIHYDSSSDSLILSDVGDPAVATDGVLHVITDVSGLIGYADDEVLTAVTLPVVAVAVGDYENQPFSVTGDTATVLGNPVDVAFDGSDLYVANKTGTTAGILLYADFLSEVASADQPVDPENPQPGDLDGLVVLDATTELAVTAAESISLVPDFLSTAP